VSERTTNLMQEHDGVFDVIPGAGLAPTIAEAIERAAREGRPITFNFSDVPVTVEPESDPEAVRNDMQHAWEQIHGTA
jgi:hypothetical protein